MNVDVLPAAKESMLSAPEEEDPLGGFDSEQMKMNHLSPVKNPLDV
jgi:hypothetical protein